MANSFSQQVLKPPDSYTQDFTVLGVSESLIHVAISLDLNIYVLSDKKKRFFRRPYRSYVRRCGIKLVKIFLICLIKDDIKPPLNKLVMKAKHRYLVSSC